jgi:hypothetical protein
LDEFDIWRVRFSAHLGREKPELFGLLSGDKDPSREANVLFACQLLQFVGDDILTRYRRQMDCVQQGVDLYRAIVNHFSTAAPAEDPAEEIFLRGLRGLIRDKFSSLSDFMREAQSLLLNVERTSGDKCPSIERLLVVHALQQLCQGQYCPWAPTLMAKYRKALRATPSMQRLGDGISFQKLLEDVSEYTTPSSGSRDSLAAGRYSSRPRCDKCQRFGHTSDQCRSTSSGAGGQRPSHGKAAHVATVAAVHAAEYAEEEIDEHTGLPYGVYCGCSTTTACQVHRSQGRPRD